MKPPQNASGFAVLHANKHVRSIVTIVFQFHGTDTTFVGRQPRHFLSWVQFLQIVLSQRAIPQETGDLCAFSPGFLLPKFRTKFSSVRPLRHGATFTPLTTAKKASTSLYICAQDRVVSSIPSPSLIFCKKALCRIIWQHSPEVAGMKNSLDAPMFSGP